MHENTCDFNCLPVTHTFAGFLQDLSALTVSRQKRWPKCGKIPVGFLGEEQGDAGFSLLMVQKSRTSPTFSLYKTCCKSWETHRICSISISSNLFREPGVKAVLGRFGVLV